MLCGESFRKPSAIRSIILTVAIMAFSTVVGIYFDRQADMILTACTAFSGSLMVFIFPAAYFLKSGDRYKVHGFERVAAYFNIVFGIIFMFVGTYFSILGMMGPK